MFHIVICDDSMEYRSYMKTIVMERVSELQHECEILECNSGEDLVFQMDKGIPVDVLILDVQLKGMDGNEAARKFRQHFPYAVLIFCSGVYQPSIESFKATPYRYILKQQLKEEICETITECLQEAERRMDEPTISTHFRQTVQMVQLRNILYFETSKRGAQVIVAPNSLEYQYEDKLLVNQKPEELLRYLEPYGFAMIKISYLINMNHVKRFNGESVVMDNGEVLNISRSYKSGFKDIFAKFSAKKYS